MITDIVRGIVEGIGLVRDLVRLGAPPAPVIRRIRADVRQQHDDALDAEIDRRFPRNDGFDVYGDGS